MCGIDSIQPTPNSILIDDWLEFEFPDNGPLFLRSAMQILVKRILANPSYHYNEHDYKLVQTVRSVLDVEEVFADLKLPVNIGDKPRFFFPLGQAVRRVRQRHNPLRGGLTQSVNAYRRNGHKNDQTNPRRDCVSDGSRLLNGLTSNGDLTDSLKTLRLTNGTRLLNGLNGVSMVHNRESTFLNGITLENKFGDYRDDKIFMLIRPKQKKSVDIAQQTNKWVFAPQTEKKILHYNRVSTFLVVFV